MYQGWVTHTHSHLGGECPHKCSYCYVNHPVHGRAPRYCGDLRLIEEEFKVSYDEKTLARKGGKVPATIFLEHCNDLFAVGVPLASIQRVMAHALCWPQNTYVFQTKDPERYRTAAVDSLIERFPNVVLGTTIESNRHYPQVMGNSPFPAVRLHHMAMLRVSRNYKLFVTIEPVLDFDVEELAMWIERIRPDFINLGADSKGKNLPEPPVEKIYQLVARLRDHGVDLREKHNLDRLTKRQEISTKE